MPVHQRVIGYPLAPTYTVSVGGNERLQTVSPIAFTHGVVSGRSVSHPIQDGATINRGDAEGAGSRLAMGSREGRLTPAR